MIKQKLKQILKQRHFWRDAGFDELTELYISCMLRTFALSLLMVFVPFYLFQHGYSVPAILLFYGYFFTGKVVADILASYFTARFGPKHSMIVSCCLQIVSAAMFVSLPSIRWPLIVLGVLSGMAASFYFIAFHVEFSKIKHTPHAGKEIGNMQIFEKMAAVLGPLCGGFAGSYLGSEYIFIVATAVLFASLVPLFRTAEPVRTHQRLRFNALPVAKIKHDLVAYTALGVENTICINLWPFYISIFALTGTVYAQLGLLTAAGVVISIVAAHFAGQYIDTKNARQLLRLSALLNASLYIFRPLTHSIAPAFLINTANEVVTTGYRMPFLKGMYAAADDLEGFRIVYIGSMECLGSLAKATVWYLLAMVAMVVSTRSVMMVGFSVAACASLVIMIEHFKALAPVNNHRNVS